jgi:hypothetical protein
MSFTPGVVSAIATFLALQEFVHVLQNLLIVAANLALGSRVWQ